MKRYWFTFIEIMIAIVVFSVGILAVLQVMTKNLSLVASSQVKTSAAMLAQESLALVFSLRDANRDKWYARDCIPSQYVFVSTTPTENDFCAYHMQDLTASGDILTLWFDSHAYMAIAVQASWAVIPTSGLVFTIGSGSTQVTRYVQFTPVKEGTHTLPTDKILKVTSVVTYNQGIKTGQVQLESFIWAR